MVEIADLKNMITGKEQEMRAKYDNLKDLEAKGQLDDKARAELEELKQRFEQKDKNS